MAQRKKRAERKGAPKSKRPWRRNSKTQTGSILDLRGLGKGLWQDEHPDDYVRRLRGNWD